MPHFDQFFLIIIIQSLQVMSCFHKHQKALCHVRQQKENCLKGNDANEKSNSSDVLEVSTLPLPISNQDLVQIFIFS